LSSLSGIVIVKADSFAYRSGLRDCRVGAETKPRFAQPPGDPLVKALRPFERISVDLKGPLPSSGKNAYIFTAVHKYSRYPVAFPSSDLTTTTVISCLSQNLRSFWFAGVYTQQ